MNNLGTSRKENIIGKTKEDKVNDRGMKRKDKDTTRNRKCFHCSSSVEGC